MRLSLLFLLLSTTLPAQVQPTVNSATNAASFADPATPEGGLPRGGIISIFGSSLGTSQIIANEFPLGFTLGNTEVEIDVGGVVTRAYPLFVGSNQINAIVSSETPAGAGELTVIVDGVRSAPLAVRIANHAPGAFTLRGTGGGPAIFTDPLDPNANTRINSGLRAAHAGEAWDLWATGLGAIPTSDAVQAPFFDRTDLDVKVLVGGKEAVILYRGRSGCCSGLDQIRFIVPDGVEGCCVPVQLVVEGVVSKTVSMSINVNGRRLCETDLLANLPDELIRYYEGDESFSFGSLSLNQNLVYETATSGTVTESASAGFAEGSFVNTTILDPCPREPSDDPTDLPTGRPFVLGPCLVYRGTMLISFDLDGNELDRLDASDTTTAEGLFAERSARPIINKQQLLITAVEQTKLALGEVEQELPFRYLDAGPSILLEGPNNQQWELPRMDLPGGFGPSYGVQISDQTSFAGEAPGQLGPGSYTFSGQGGPDVGSFSVSASNLGLEWTNVADAFPEIPRDRPLPIRWMGEAEGLDSAVISGSSFPAGSGFTFSSFTCVTELSTGGMTLHPNMLREVYASDLETPQSGTLAVGLSTARVASISGVETTGVGSVTAVTAIAPFTGEGVDAPMIRFSVKVDPAYPPAAREAGIEGVVEILATIDTEGKVTPILPPTGHPMLVEAVNAVIDEWRVADAGLLGFAEITVTFSLADGVSCEISNGF